MVTLLCASSLWLTKSKLLVRDCSSFHFTEYSAFVLDQSWRPVGGGGGWQRDLETSFYDCGKEIWLSESHDGKRKLLEEFIGVHQAMYQTNSGRKRWVFRWSIRAARIVTFTLFSMRTLIDMYFAMWIYRDIGGGGGTSRVVLQLDIHLRRPLILITHRVADWSEVQDTPKQSSQTSIFILPQTMASREIAARPPKLRHFAQIWGKESRIG